jgi:guanine deaminase
MSGTLNDTDRRYLQMAVKLSCGYLEDGRRWPFGAIVVAAGQVVGRGVNQVVELRDPTAHAEVLALRAAGQALGTHQFENATLYSSSEPCPMCLAACYWARLDRVVFAATTHDVAANGFSDLGVYEQLRLPAESRSLPEVADGNGLREQAVAALRDWAGRQSPNAPHAVGQEECDLVSMRGSCLSATAVEL